MVSRSDLEWLRGQYPDMPWAMPDRTRSNATQAAKQERWTDSEQDLWRQMRMMLGGLVGESARRDIPHARQ